MSEPLLLPAPRALQRGTDAFTPRDDQFIRLIADWPAELMMAGRVVQRAVRDATRQKWLIIAGGGGPAENIAATIAIDAAVAHNEGYTLTISPSSIHIAAHDPAGAFYGAQTLAQLLRLFPDALPVLRIEDHPDFPHRGVMLDISRDKVPTMATLFTLVDELAAMKINQLQLYTEHTFAYRAHPQVWAQASPMTGQDILELDHYCRERFVELVPNQNSFGHLERWLNHPRYLSLAETINGFDTPWDHRDYAFSLCPLDPGSIEFVASLYDELLPHFSSRMLNVGCDETFDLGQGRSKEECLKRGRERVYLDFLLKIYKLVKERGRTMQFWGDIILHKPDLVPELPKDIIALEWGYEADHPFDKDGEIFSKAGVPFYVCPGTSSWLSMTGRTDNAIANLKSAAENGLKHGAIGYLNTDWGDKGHLQYLPVSYLGFAAGAAYGWNYAGNRDLSLPDALDLHIFRDRARVTGKLAYDLGLVYKSIKKPRRNSTILFWSLIGDRNHKDVEGVSRAEYDAAESATDAIMANLDRARMNRPDASLIADEFRNAAAMLHHAARRGRWRLGLEDPSALADDLASIIAHHRRLWLARNREGGLAESSGRLENALKDYRK